MINIKHVLTIRRCDVDPSTDLMLGPESREDAGVETSVLQSQRDEEMQ